MEVGEQHLVRAQAGVLLLDRLLDLEHQLAGLPDLLGTVDGIHEAYIYVHPTAFPMGVRIAEYMGKGYEPIGYFQLWNPMHSGVYEYPTQHGRADRTDVLHAKAFARLRRQLIPELLCIHLDSEGLGVAEMGKNWNGRKTLPFTIDYALGSKGYGPGFWMMIWLILTDLWVNFTKWVSNAWKAVKRFLGFNCRP